MISPQNINTHFHMYFFSAAFYRKIKKGAEAIFFMYVMFNVSENKFSFLKRHEEEEESHKAMKRRGVTLKTCITNDT